MPIAANETVQLATGIGTKSRSCRDSGMKPCPSQPAKAKELAALWRTWAERAHVLPAPGAEGGKKKVIKYK